MTNNWISVKEKLPEEGKYYLVYLHEPKEMTINSLFNLDASDDPDWGYITLAYFNIRQGGFWEMEFDHTAYGTNLSKIDTTKEYYVSHWMKLPEKPED